jgi:hypothetical protein
VLIFVRSERDQDHEFLWLECPQGKLSLPPEAAGKAGAEHDERRFAHEPRDHLLPLRVCDVQTDGANLRQPLARSANGDEGTYLRHGSGELLFLAVAAEGEVNAVTYELVRD